MAAIFFDLQKPLLWTIPTSQNKTVEERKKEKVLTMKMTSKLYMCDKYRSFICNDVLLLKICVHSIMLSRILNVHTDNVK